MLSGAAGVATTTAPAGVDFFPRSGAAGGNYRYCRGGVAVFSDMVVALNMLVSLSMRPPRAGAAGGNS